MCARLIRENLRTHGGDVRYFCLISSTNTNHVARNKTTLPTPYISHVSGRLDGPAETPSAGFHIA